MGKTEKGKLGRVTVIPAGALPHGRAAMKVSGIT
jgi:hypothetical protein